MQLLLRNVTIQDKNSSHNGHKVDIAVDHGVITKIGTDLNLNAAFQDFEIHDFTTSNALASVGWFDMRSFVGEPGKEQCETLDTLEAACAVGGFTEVAVLPNTEPPVHSGEMVENLRLKSEHRLVKIHSLAAVTRDFDGVNLTEMVDLHQKGAVGFTDVHPLHNSNTMQLALQYARPINGLIVNVPMDQGMSMYKMVHEGEVSTRLGLPGIPDDAEEMMIDRDCRLAEYTGGSIHFSMVTSQKGLERIRQAKEKGLNVTCDTAAYYLHLSDEQLVTFDSMFKVFPPLRSESDKEALIEAVKSGLIDVVVSGHTPLNAEQKDLEFDRAEYGISTEETTFSLLNELVDMDVLLDKLVYGPRNVLNIDCPVIEEGNQANITVFDPDMEQEFLIRKMKSKGRNNPFDGKIMKGKVLAILRDTQFKWN